MGGAVLTGFTITGGENETEGGGIKIVRSSPVLSHLVVAGNVSGSRGGGLYAGSSDSLKIFNCQFIDNSSTLIGGGVYLCGEDYTIRMEDFEIANNESRLEEDWRYITTAVLSK